MKTILKPTIVILALMSASVATASEYYHPPKYPMHHCSPASVSQYGGIATSEEEACDIAIKGWEWKMHILTDRKYNWRSALKKKIECKEISYNQHQCKVKARPCK